MATRGIQRTLAEPVMPDLEAPVTEATLRTQILGALSGVALIHSMGVAETIAFQPKSIDGQWL